jgi:hypothetical protein
MPLIDGFGLPARLIVWIRAQPSGVSLEVDMGEVLEELRRIHPPLPDLGTADELWSAIRQADAEDEALGNANQWRSFVLVAWASDDGAPRTIRFMCPRSTWELVP